MPSHFTKLLEAAKAKQCNVTLFFLISGIGRLISFIELSIQISLSSCIMSDNGGESVLAEYPNVRTFFSVLPPVPFLTSTKLRYAQL